MKGQRTNRYIILALICIFCSTMIGCGLKSRVNVSMSDFDTPDSFQWEGTYVDETTGQVTLTIEKGVMGYECQVNSVDSSMSHLECFQFTAKEDNTKALAYTDGVRSSFDIPDFETNPEGETINEEIYTDGTGCIYYLDGKVYWIDDVDDYGKNYVFYKQE